MGLVASSSAGGSSLLSDPRSDAVDWQTIPSTSVFASRHYQTIPSTSLHLCSMDLLVDTLLKELFLVVWLTVYLHLWGMIDMAAR